MENPDSRWHDAPLNNLYAITGPDLRMSESRPLDTAADPLGSQRPQLQSLLAELEALASGLEGQPAALLELLRLLEQLHRQIQDGAFRASLPADRNQLFRLLQQMEASGGWPYIPRPQLRTFMDLMQNGPGVDSAADLGADDALAA